MQDGFEVAAELLRCLLILVEGLRRVVYAVAYVEYLKARELSVLRFLCRHLRALSLQLVAPSRVVHFEIC